MNESLLRALSPLAILAARVDRRLEAWRHRAGLMLLASELGDRLTLGSGCRLERGIFWRIGDTGRLMLGNDAVIRAGVELKVDGLLAIGERSLIGAWCTLSVLDELRIGNDCLLAERVSIRDHDHRYGDPERPVADQGYEVAPVRLGNNVWVGAGVTLMKGVELGDGCVVGANSVVTRSFPAGSVIVGAPARCVKRIVPPSPSHVLGAPPQSTGFPAQGHPCPPPSQRVLRKSPEGDGAVDWDRGPGHGWGEGG